MAYQVTHFINGKKTANPQGRFQDIYNPAFGQSIGTVAYAEQTEVNAAVAAAAAAFPAWSATPAPRRARILHDYLALLKQHIEPLAQLITQEHGKTISDAKGSIQRGLEVVEFACGAPQLLKGSFSAEIGSEIDCYTLRQPLGVCAGITPFNFPAMVPLWMFPLAMACGNTFVLKPSEKNPSSAMLLAELFQQAGGPDGVLNIVNGDKATVDLLLHHPEVAAVSFVGSTPVAAAIYQTATAQGKRAQAFGGAKNHCVVMPDANLDQTAAALVGAAYGSAGERCMAISVVVAVGDSLADQLVEKLRPLITQLTIGLGTDPNNDMGPLITAEHRNKVKAYVDLGVQEGAHLAVDGRDFTALNYPNGFFLGGCLFDHVTANMRIYQEEIFGPVLSIVRVADLASAIQLINDHPYGNGTAIFTNSGAAARTFVHQVKVGMVGINVPIPVPLPFHPFGGWKRSVFGDTQMYGEESIQFYTRPKTVTARWPTATQVQTAEFAMPTHHK